MLVPFLIMLREGIEAALVVGIIASFLRHTGRAALMPAVWAGVFLALGLCLFAGAGLQWLTADFPQRQQELFEAIVGLIAVGMLTGMVFWMRKASRSITGELQASVDKALSGSGGSWALIGMVFLAVAREGLESVFFMLAIFQQSEGSGAAWGALLGIAVSVLLGMGLYQGAVRIDLRRFFRYTGVFILLVAAGLLAGAVRRLHEAGIWNHWQQVVFDSSAVLPQDSPLGVVLGGLLGYMHAPVLGEVLAWALFLALTLALFFWPAKQAAAPSPTQTASAVPAVVRAPAQTSGAQQSSRTALVVSILVLLGGGVAFWWATTTPHRPVPRDGLAEGGSVVTVEIGEGKCTPASVTVPAGRTQFRIVNRSQRALEWEILDGVMVLEERENILPGMTQTLNARLVPGTYEMTCGLLNAPRGKLVVTSSAAFETEAAKPPVIAFVGALAEYQVYLQGELISLQDMVQALQQRLEQPDQAEALAQADDLPADPRALVALARGQYQKLVPIAVQYGDLNARIDARAADFAQREKDPAFVGLQRIAMGLQAAPADTDVLPLVQALQADLAALGERLGSLQLQPSSIAAASAKALERASTLVPGEATTAEQGRWALQFVWGSWAGAVKAERLLQPMLSRANPVLAQQLQTSLAKVEQLLHEQGVSTADDPAGQMVGAVLNPVQCQNFAQALYQASQAMSKVNAALALQP